KHRPEARADPLPYTTLFRSDMPGPSWNDSIQHMNTCSYVVRQYPYTIWPNAKRSRAEAVDGCELNYRTVTFLASSILTDEIITEDRKSTRLNSSHVKTSYAG